MKTALITIALVLAAAAPAAASDGTYTQILCANPSTGHGVGAQGVHGLTTPATVLTWRPTISAVNCGDGPMTDVRAIKLESRTDAWFGDGDYAALNYRVAEPSITLRSATYFRAFRVAHATDDSRTMIVQHGGEQPAEPTAPQNPADFQWTVAQHSPRGRLDRPFAPENQVRAEHNGRQFSITARCSNTSCHHSTGDWTYSFFGGTAELADTSPPTVTDVSGTLTTGTASGTADLVFSADDAGAGLYRFRLVVDGEEWRARRIPGGTACTDANPSNDDPYEFTHQQPCSAGTRFAEQLDTTKLTNGTHRIRALIEDAGGNQTEILNRTVAVRNQPSSPTAPADGQHSPAALNAAVTAPVQLAPPAPTLARAPEHPGARVSLSVGPRRTTKLRTTYTSRPKVHGRLVDATGRPLVNQTVTFTVRDASPGAPTRPAGLATTRADGTFIAQMPGGASRTITATFEYARAVVKLVVPAAVSLKIGSARVGRPTILTGRLLHAPKAGVLIQIQAADGRRWRTFDTVRTRRGGVYRYSYRFKPTARGRTFALRVFVDSAVYPFAPQPSKAATVRVF